MKSDILAVGRAERSVLVLLVRANLAMTLIEADGCFQEHRNLER
jgi:hypothetical protein